jgi:hypothetical protein
MLSAARPLESGWNLRIARRGREFDPDSPSAGAESGGTGSALEPEVLLDVALVGEEAARLARRGRQAAG